MKSALVPSQIAGKNCATKKESQKFFSNVLESRKKCLNSNPFRHKIPNRFNTTDIRKLNLGSVLTADGSIRNLHMSDFCVRIFSFLNDDRNLSLFGLSFFLLHNNKYQERMTVDHRLFARENIYLEID